MNLDSNVCEKITAFCLNFFDSEKPAAPLEMLECIWQDSGIAMHCPEHHYLLPAVLLTSVRRQLGDERQLLEQDLAVALERADNVLGGFCGNYGACGAAVGCGIFLSILTGTSPHSVQNWAQVNLITAEALTAIAGVDGPAAASATPICPCRPQKNSCRNIMISSCQKPHLPARTSPSTRIAKGSSAHSSQRSMIPMPRIEIHTEKIAKPKFKESDCPCKKQPVDMRFKSGVIHWLKEEGEAVRAGQPIALAEVEKAVIEIESPAEGILAEICVEDYDTFKYGTILGYIETNA